MTMEHRKEQIENREVRFDNGVARWTSNDSVVPEECAVQFAEITDKCDVKACAIARQKEIEDFFAHYEPRAFTEEEKAEMDCVFGSGETVVNLVSGERYRTR